MHSAVDPDQVMMTTHLAGRATRFLPFNQGTAGPGERSKAASTVPATGTWSSTRPARGSRTPSPGWPTGCRRGGTLLIGVDDRGGVVGLDAGTRGVTDPAEIDRYITTRWPGAATGSRT